MPYQQKTYTQPVQQQPNQQLYQQSGGNFSNGTNTNTQGMLVTNPN
jgi:hypothetical protein